MTTTNSPATNTDMAPGTPKTKTDAGVVTPDAIPGAQPTPQTKPQQ
jgi:hypothetical protein